MTKKELLLKLGIVPQTIKILDNNTIINDKYIIKDRKKNTDIYEYLKTRGFTYFPTVYTTINDEVEIEDYIKEENIPLQQKLEDIAYIDSILHLTTVFDKKIDLDSIKEIYENTINQLDNIYKYYYDKQNKIEEEIYMSPSNYLLIRNISLIYKSIKLSRFFLDKWYNLVKDNSTIRYTYIHSNLKESKLKEKDNYYLIGLDKGKLSFPIEDISIFYNNSYLDISLSSILKIYEKKFPLKEEEKFLLFSKLLIPRTINTHNTEYKNTEDVSNLITYISDTYDCLKDYSNKTNNNSNN